MIAIRDSRIVRIAVTASLLAFPVGAGADEQRGDSSIPRRQWPQSMAAGAVSIDQSTVTETHLGATRPWSRVSVPDPVAGHATRAALDRGWTLLGQSTWARIRTVFDVTVGRTRLVTRTASVRAAMLS